jgi:FAD synthetase
LPRKKKVIVFAAGCFNRIHQAHVQMLKNARALGDELVVVLSNDAHNRKPNAVPSKTRLRWMKELGLADRVVVGKPTSFAASLREIKPNILVLGYDQKLPDGETAKAVKELGVEIVVMPWFPGNNDTCARN